MVVTTKIFQLRPTPLPIAAAHTHTPTPTSVHFFSSSSSSSSSSTPDSNSNPTSESPPQSQSQSQSRSAFSDFFSDVKATLKHSEQQRSNQSQQPPRNTFSMVSPFRNQPTRPRNHADEEAIRKNLAEFRRRTVPPPPPNALGSISAPPNSPEPVSFVKLFDKVSKGEGLTPVEPRLSLRDIRDSLSKIKPKQNENDKTLRLNEPMSPSYTPDQYTKPSSTVFGGSGPLPAPVFGPERAKGDGDGSAKEMSSKFVKMYGHQELGEKLRSLRPEKKGDNKDWFSLEELNQRLVKLREMEERKSESMARFGVEFNALRKSLVNIDTSTTTEKRQPFKLDALGLSGTTPGYMLSPPKEDLVEKYFHPDNMSASEKLKLELNKVRDEFKLSESDCGSSRVQVAQLTTKIKHLSGVLHPKDKHSKKGLQAMVEKRKKLLKYMRRTDWDSYCFVLSKLGLRDNPGYKH